MMVQTQYALPAKSSLYKLLAVTYTVLLGFVLPFICWGALATPGHPHRVAHLVFLTPLMYAEDTIEKAEIDHSALQHQARSHEVDQPASATQPVGRSVPDQLSSAISIITPLFIVQILLTFAAIQAVLRLAQPTLAHLFDPRVSTPPPRLFLD